MKTALPVIKTEWLVWGAGAGLLLAFIYAQKDNNGDGKADGLAGNLGFDLGHVAPDFVGGVAKGTFDGVAGIFGGSNADCERAKAQGDKVGILWACWPSDWPKAFK